MQYLTTEDVIRINAEELGSEVAVDFGLLSSAVLRPQTSVMGSDAYPDIHAKAAAMLHSLVRNHPFLDGNKRTAWIATVVLYYLNLFRVVADDEGDVVALCTDIAEGQLDVPAIATLLKKWATEIDVPLSSPDEEEDEQR